MNPNLSLSNAFARETPSDSIQSEWLEKIQGLRVPMCRKNLVWKDYKPNTDLDQARNDYESQLRSRMQGMDGDLSLLDNMFNDQSLPMIWESQFDIHYIPDLERTLYDPNTFLQNRTVDRVWETPSGAIFTQIPGNLTPTLVKFNHELRRELERSWYKFAHGKTEVPSLSFDVQYFISNELADFNHIVICLELYFLE